MGDALESAKVVLDEYKKELAKAKRYQLAAGEVSPRAVANKKQRQTSPIHEAPKRFEPDVDTSYGKTALTAPERNDVDYGQDSEDDNQEPISDTEQKTHIVSIPEGGNQSVPYADPVVTEGPRYVL